MVIIICFFFFFSDVQNVRFCRLHCTICDRHLGCGSDVEDKVTVHNMLKVLVCKACYEFYGDGNFPCDAVDNCEIYCRWCGQGGALVCCSFCPRVFCKVSIKNIVFEKKDGGNLKKRKKIRLVM